jgi:hypothetical protein
VLVKKEVDGASLRFTNGVEIDQVNGEVYFTDSSMNYQRSQHKMVTYEIQRLNGPPHRYDLRTGKSLGNVTTTYYICGVQVESRATTKICFFL